MSPTVAANGSPPRASSGQAARRRWVTPGRTSELPKAMEEVSVGAEGPMADEI